MCSIPNIDRVEIYLDDDMPEYMDGIIRIGSINLYDEDGEEVKSHKDLVDNTEFHEEAELIKYVADNLCISEDIIEIIE